MRGESRRPATGPCGPAPGAGAVVMWMLIATFALGAAWKVAGQSLERTRYELAATLEPEGGWLTGTATIRPTAPARPVRLNVATGSGRMEILGVRDAASGVELPFLELAGESFITVEPPATGIPEGIAVEYRFALQSAPAPFEYNLLSSDLGTPWYPELQSEAAGFVDFRDYDVQLRYPRGYALLTTGGAARPQKTADMLEANFEVGGDEDFTIALGRGFVVEEDTAGDVPVQSFFHPDLRDRFDVVRARTVEAVGWYRDTYGFFPRKRVGIVQGHPRWSGGFPMAGVFMVHLGTLDDNFLAFITAHELGHYYWGLHVLGAEERLDWLVLANGIWIDQLYLARRSGRTLAEQWRRTRDGAWILDYLRAMVANRTQRLGITGPNTDPDFDYNSLVRHGKGAAGVFLQSLLLGPEGFLSVQKDLLRRFPGRALTVDDFVAALEAAGVGGADAFFRAWVRNDARIGARVQSVTTTEKGEATVVLSRTAGVPYPVPVWFVAPTGDTVRYTLAASARRDTVTLASPPARILFDPEGVVPMWNTSHPAMRSLMVQAALIEGLDGLAVPLALAHLDAHPDDHETRYRLVLRLYETGRWGEAAEHGPVGTRCADPDQCRAALYRVLALSQEGRGEEAAALLEELAAGAEEAGVGRLLERVRRQLHGGAGSG